MGHYPGQLLTVEWTDYGGFVCEEHGTVQVLRFVGHPTRRRGSGCCHHAVRRPIDFKSTLNISDVIKTPHKETEDA